MNERIPPHNDEAEKSVLGALLLDGDALQDVMELLRAEDFYSEAHREIFRGAEALYQRRVPVDALTVSDELKRRKSLEMAGGRGYIAMLSTVVPAFSNAAQYARIVAEKSLLRRLIGAASDIMEDAYRDARDARESLDDAERSILEIAQSGQRKDFGHIVDALRESVERIESVAEAKGLTGLTTGFADLDRLTSGLQRSDLIVVAARPGVGKTAFALNIAHHAAMKAKAHVMIFSLEMSRSQLANRFLSMQSRVDISRLRDGRLGGKDWDDINEAIDEFLDTAIFIDDTPGISVMEIRSKARRLKAEKGLELIIVDYLQLMRAEGRSESRTLEIAGITRMLKQLAREMDCPVIVLSQLSRDVEKHGKRRPILSDLRDSGAIEQDADIVVFLSRETVEDDDMPIGEQNVCEVSIAKHRNGETALIELTWVGRYTKFGDRARGA
ncbi:MAG: replicative DNA helicase, partial [Clostridiales Family XIII bacterium]|nr:replicative DNA helicase [Clostridiales Family XIII bacterium]